MSIDTRAGSAATVCMHISMSSASHVEVRGMLGTTLLVMHLVTESKHRLTRAPTRQCIRPFIPQPRHGAPLAVSIVRAADLEHSDAYHHGLLAVACQITAV